MRAYGRRTERSRRIGCLPTGRTVGSSGANFLAGPLARLGDVRRIRATRPRSRGAVVRGRGSLPRPFAGGYAVEPEAIAVAITPRTRLVVLTRPHNPSGAVIDGPTLETIADRRARASMCWWTKCTWTLGGASLSPAALVSDRFISTSSLTKPTAAGLRCGWALAAPASPPDARRRAVGRRRRRRRNAWPCGPRDLALCRSRPPDHREQSPPCATNAWLGRDDVAWVPGRRHRRISRLLRVADVDGFVDRLLVEHHTAVVPGRFLRPPAARAGRLRHGGRGTGGGLDAVAAASTPRPASKPSPMTTPSAARCSSRCA